MKQFCIAGPIDTESHYFLPQRLDWQQLDSFLKGKFYFILHAPRQSGKTSAIREYIKHLKQIGDCTPFYLSLESAHIKPLG